MKQIPKLIFCATGNKYYAEIATRYGLRYGAQPGTVYQPIEFADQPYAKPHNVATKASEKITDPIKRQRVYVWTRVQAEKAMRKEYMAFLAKHRPAVATVLDLERPCQFKRVVSWAKEAQQYVKKVIIIPKYAGAIAQLISVFGLDWIAGYSVKTSYGETTVDKKEFAVEGLEVHLLGGNPDEQYRIAPLFNTVSVDVNMHMRHAGLNMFFSNTRTRAKNKSWPMLKESVFGYVKEETNRLAFTLSCMNINAMWQGCKATVRFAVERDIPQILKIAHMYRNELGYVNPMSLRESIARRNLIVASHNSAEQINHSDLLVSQGSEKILGFVNYRACRDGWQTVYEIGVHRDWKGQKIGAGLLSAVPSPVRLKCTTDNATGNTFYESMGFKHMGVDAGKKRPLNMWHRVKTEAVMA